MKIYLKDLTLEEVIKRLKNGEIIKVRNSEIYTRMVDDIIVRFFSKNKPYINPAIDLNNDNFYFEIKEPLTFEEGKFYKTREGKKAYISKITTTYIYGIITGKTTKETWYLDGMYWHNGDEHKNDLISKWED